MANVRRTSLNLISSSSNEAKKALGTTGTTETVHRALEEAWRREALEAARRVAVRHRIDIEEFRQRRRGSTRRYP